MPNYNMGTYTVTDCRAKFYDDGGPSQPYLSILNSTVTKTLSIHVGVPITMTFNPLNTQTQIQAGDFISFYDGPNAQSPLISGPFTNINGVNILPTVIAPSGSLTVVWTENGNTVGHGWDGGWFASAPPPTAPTASLASVPQCNASVITLTTSEGVICDSLKANFFIITGPVFPVISTITPVPCNNGTTTTIQIQLSQPLNKNCSYTINSTLFRKDRCDSAYKFMNIINTFSIGNCPIQASLNVSSTNTVCAYSCSANISAVVPASVCLNLAYSWTPALPPTPGPHAVCPSVTTTYSCTIIEQSTFTQTMVTTTIYVIDPQIAPLASNTICTSAPVFNFTGTPSGGTWSGAGITNTTTGTFCPACTGAGVKTVTYTVGNCKATITFTTVLTSAGSDDAACLNGPTFTVSGGSPGGGTWSGSPLITSGGVFTPTVIGTHTVFYTLGSCSDVKLINVTNTITVPTTTVNICQSEWYRYLYTSVAPFGGRFYGTGIVNSVYGTYSPSIVPPGTYVITYSLATGCSATFAINVKDINVSPSTATTCPTKAPFVPFTSATPLGGTWTCTNSAGSILNSSTGMYNPSVFSINSHTDILVYTATNGCSDTLKILALKTTINSDSLFFCVNSPSLQITNNFTNFGYSPAGGVYSGTGVSFSAGNYFFNPNAAGAGIHTIYYDINTCTDSIKMVVYPNVLSNANATVCSTHPTMMVVNPPLPVGTTWSGPGIITPSLGVFSASNVIAGNTYTYTYSNKGGCSSSLTIYVYPFVPASITNLNNTYCYRNITTTYNLSPPNGTFTTLSAIGNNTFNPSVIGAGTYTVNYSFGVGACLTSTTIVVKVHPQLTTSTSISSPTICTGEASLLNVNASGGLPTIFNYTYTWSNNLIGIANQNVVPAITTVYTVTTTDGCSDPVTDTMRVTVKPTFYSSFSVNPKICYGSPGNATVNITPAGNYTYTWVTNPVQSGSVINGPAGKSYQVKITDLSTGCKKDTSIIIPSYNAIQALFSPNPNMSCIPFENNLVSFLDLCNGALSGNWNFNGAIRSYTPGQTETYEFKDPGTYTVSLSVVNDGNCPSDYLLNICILPSTEIFIPDIFSPNNDGNNDVLFVRSNGLKEMRFAIYDRLGNKVFESTDVGRGWDGTYNGSMAEQGVYAYVLEGTLVTDKKVTKKGDISLIR